MCVGINGGAWVCVEIKAGLHGCTYKLKQGAWVRTGIKGDAGGHLLIKWGIYLDARRNERGCNARCMGCVSE